MLNSRYMRNASYHPSPQYKLSSKLICCCLSCVDNNLIQSHHIWQSTYFGFLQNFANSRNNIIEFA